MSALRKDAKTIASVGAFLDAVAKIEDGWSNDCDPPLRSEVRRAGITRSSLFPDLDGLCADLKWDMEAKLKARPGPGGRRP
jgi:hypothetical protein